MRCPIYSIRLPYAFQVKETVLMPMGTTLYGLLVYSLLNIEPRTSALMSPDGSVNDLKNLNMVYNQLLELISMSTRIPRTSRVVSFRTVWKVIRYDRVQELMSRYKRDYAKVCMHIFNNFIKQGTLTGVSDAMIKQLAYANEIIISMISEGEAISLNLGTTGLTTNVRDLVKGLTYLTRLGDTESYCSVLNCYAVKDYEVIELNKDAIIDSVNTVTILGSPNNQVLSLINGAAIVTYFNSPLIGLFRTTPNYAIYALPLRAESHIVHGKHVSVYVPSKYSLRSKIHGVYAIKYKSPIDREEVTHIFLPSYITQLSLTKAPRTRRRKRRVKR